MPGSEQGWLRVRLRLGAKRARCHVLNWHFGRPFPARGSAPFGGNKRGGRPTRQSARRARGVELPTAAVAWAGGGKAAGASRIGAATGRTPQAISGTRPFLPAPMRALETGANGPALTRGAGRGQRVAGGTAAWDAVRMSSVKISRRARTATGTNVSPGSFAYYKGTWRICQAEYKSFFIFFFSKVFRTQFHDFIP